MARKRRSKKTHAEPLKIERRKGSPRWYGKEDARIFGAFYYAATRAGQRLQPPKVARDILRNKAHPLRAIPHLAAAIKQPDSVLVDWLAACVGQMAYNTIVIPEHVLTVDPQNLAQTALQQVPEHWCETTYVPANGEPGGFGVFDLRNPSDAEEVRKSMLWHFDRMLGYTERYVEKYPIWRRIAASLRGWRAKLEHEDLGANIVDAREPAGVTG